MTENSFIIDNFRFSYSGASSFNICKYMWKLTYLDAKPRISGWFSDYGLFCHKILEKYFRGELELWDLPKYYEDNYGLEITSSPPPYPLSMPQNYYDAGLNYFNNFDFDKSLYDVLIIEEAIESEYNGIILVVKPDLILREKSSGKCILIDFKTAKIKVTKKDQEKQIEDYKNQFFLYAYFLWQAKNIEIKEIRVWFIRDNVEKIIPMNMFEVQNTLDWFEETIKTINAETEWNPNLTKENDYFCQQICSMRNECTYRNA
jgi:hypothetical protein